MTLNEMGKKEVERIKKILKKTNISEKDLKECLLTIQRVYFEWHKTATTLRTLERILEEDCKIKEKKLEELFKKKILEEEKKYPFECEELESEEK